MTLLRKMLRDMRAGKAQFISIFLMAFLGVFVFVGIGAEWKGMRAEADRYYAETDFPDLWVYGSDFSASDARAVGGISGVVAVSRRLTVDAAADLPGDPTLRVSILDDDGLSRPYVLDGAALDLSLDGVWLDESFAAAHNLSVGDALTVSASGVKLTKTILGLVIHPEYVYEVKDDSTFTPDPDAFGFALMPRAAIPLSNLLPHTEILAKLASGADAAAVRAQIEALLAPAAILTRQTQGSAAQFQNEIDQNRAMAGLFPAVFFLIAALAMLTTMTRLTASQRTQIGTLKALGFRRGKILFHYVSYGLWLGLAGGALGFFAGPRVLPPILFSMQKTVYHMPAWRSAVTWTDGLAVLLAAASCGGASFFACRRELADVPAETLRPRAPKASRHTRLEKSRLWRALGFSVQWNLRDILRGKVRSVMAVTGVMGCVTILLLALGLNDSMAAVSRTHYGETYACGAKIALAEDITDAQIAALSDACPGQLVQEGALEIAANGVQKSGTLTVLAPGDDYRLPGAEIPQSGAAISRKMAQLLSVGAGDSVRFRVYGESDWREVRIALVYRAPIGQGLLFSRAAWEELGMKMAPTALLADGDGAGAAEMDGVAGVQTIGSMRESFEAILESIRGVVALLILAAAILGIVVLYNLGSLSLTERAREMATLKVLGFPDGRIRGLLSKQNAWLTALGILPGIPLGYLCVALMLGTITDATDFAPAVSWHTYLVCVAGTFLLSWLVNLTLSRRVGSIDMVGALKSVE